MSLTSNDIMKNSQSYPIDVAKIRSLLWSPFYIAADCLLDMMNYIFWDGRDKSEFKTTVCFSFWVTVKFYFIQHRWALMLIEMFAPFDQYV